MCFLPCGRSARTLLVLLGLLSLLSHRGTAATPPTPTATLTFSAAADTYVDGSAVSKTFGTAKTMIADASPVKVIYLRFVVSGVSGRQVQSGRLKLGVNAGGAPGGTVHRITNTTWNEATVNFKTRPAVDGPGLATLAKLSTGAVATFELGTAITGDGTYSLAIDTTSSAAITYNSTQATSGQKPVLELTVALTNPTVTIAQPPSGASFFAGDLVTLQGSARDGVGADLSPSITWSSNVAGTLGRGALVTTSSLGQGPHAITAAVTDGNGLTGSARTDITIAARPPANTAPLVTITAPTNGQVLAPATPAILTATATDLEQGNLGASLAWTSDRDGPLGTGTTLNRTLSVGTHRLTTSVTDGGGLTGSATAVAYVGVVMEFTPTADVSVDSALPSDNFGTTPLLRVDANAVRIAYLRFDVGGIGTSSVLGATLRLQVDAAAGADSDSGGVLRTISATTWPESALTYDSRPLVNGPILSTRGPVTLGQVVDFDATAAVTGDGAYAFAVTSNSIDEATYRSREGGPAPKLIVIVAGNPPTVTITAPANQTVEFQGTPLAFTAQATDSTGANLGSSIQWTSSKDGPLGTGIAVDGSNLTVGTHTVTAAVTDAIGLRGQAQVTVRVRGANQPPALAINAPLPGTSVPAGTTIGLDASAVDDWDGNVTSRIQWSDSQDGSLGAGGTRTVTLREGPHTLTAAVTDTDGASSSAQVQATVTPTVPVVTIAAPAEGAVVLTPASATFTGTALDATDGNLTTSLRWTSDRDGLIGTGGSFSTNRLSLGTHVVTAAVTDAGGLAGQAQRTVITRKPNLPPTVAIATPASGASLLTGKRALLAAVATDPEDGDLGASLRWTSSRDGVLGTGGMLLVPSLSVGTHVLTASVTDRDGTTAGASVTVTVVASTLTFAAVGDTYVDGGNTATLFGTAAALWVDASPVKQAFLRFTVSGVGSFGVDQARLRLTAAPVTAAPSNSGGTVNAITNTIWTEASTTYKTKPTVDGTVLGTQGAVTSGQVVDLDVLNAVHADGTYNLALTTTSTDEVIYNSREAASGQPQLVLSLTQNTAPAVRITAPTSGSVVSVGLPVTFTAVATDAESGDVSSAIRWSSSRDGLFGLGATVTVGLSGGLHTITATATDAGGKAGSTTITVNVNAVPTVTITAPVAGTSYERGAPVTFTGAATDVEDGTLTAIITWTSSRDGLLGTGGSITTSALTSGSHTVTAAVTDSAGKTSTRSLAIIVNATPVLTITAPAAGAPLEPARPVTFTATATDVEDGDLGAQVAWRSSRDGVLGTGASLVVPALTSGTHTITATVTDGGGKTATATRSFVVNAKPVVTITAPAAGTRVEPATPITFTATATDAEDGTLATQVAWTSSRDGALGTGASLSVGGLSSGVHTITAAVTDQGGKTGQATLALTVNAVPHVAITAPAAGAWIDPGTPATLTATATDVEDGDLAAQIAWTSSRNGALGSGATLVLTTLSIGTHTLTATVTDQGGAIAFATVTVIVDTAPVVIIVAPTTVTELYPGTPIALSATATDAEDGTLTSQIAWTSSRNGALGTGGSLTVAQLSSGTHTLTATVTDHAGRTGQATLTVLVDAKPVVQITAPAADSHAEPGMPLALAATATDLEDGALASAVAWTSSRDGTLGTGGTLSVSTLSTGVHTLTASVTDASGRHGSARVAVLVDTTPVVTITAPATGIVVEPGTMVALGGTATDVEDGNLDADIVWTSNRDGAIGTGPSVSAGSLTSGTHTITAQVADHSGLVGHATITVTVNATPVLHLTAPAADVIVDPGTSVTFAATATDAEDGDLGTHVTWTSSRDGALGTGAQIATAVLTAGAHTITASVTDAGSKSASATVTVVVDAAPTLAITAPAAHERMEPGIPIAFAATATDLEQGDLGSQVTWTSSRDGGIGTGEAITVSTLTIGTHTVTAAVTDAAGRSASASVVVVVSTAPHVTITAPTSGTIFELGAAATFTATATDTEDGDLSAQIEWASDRAGVLGTGGTVVTTVLQSGTHQITAAVTDTSGERTEARITVIVNATPAVAITAPAAGALLDPASVTFTATATDAEDGSLAAGVVWTSSRDGALGTGGTITAGPLSSGPHTITASATDSGAKTGSATRTITIDQAPQVAITAPAGGTAFEPGTPIALTATATDLEDGNLAAAVTWTSSLDGALGTGSPLVVSTLGSGTHTITAAVADASGKTASTQVTLVVNATPTIAIDTPADGALFAPGDLVHLTGHAADLEDGNLSASILWISSRDGLLGAGTLDVTTLHSGTHRIRASVTDHGGKTASVERTVIVNGPPTLHIDAPADGALFAPGALIAFAATAADVEDGNLGAAVTWTSSLYGPLGTGATLGVTTLHSGTHQITATVADAGGRTASATITVVVNAAPTLEIDSPLAGAVFSPGDVVTLAAVATDLENGDLGAGIAWTSSLDGPLGTGATLGVDTLRSGTHVLTATVADTGGLVASAQRTIVVNAAPTLTVDTPAEGTVFAPGDPVHLGATASDLEDGDVSVLVTWTSSLDGPLGTGATLDVALVHSGVHQLTATVVDAGGKTTSATRSVVVNAAPTLQIDTPADAAVFSPGAITFTATASDVEDGNLGTAVAWTSSLDGALGTGIAIDVTTLRSGTHLLTATVADSGGRTASVQRTIVANAAPTLTIGTPADGTVFSPNEAVHFTATATDLENGNLSAVTWTSDLDGALGTGATLDKGLVHSGVHTITATVADLGGKTASATRSVTVNAAPTVQITGPADAALFAPGDLVPLTGTGTDLEDGSLTAAIVWASDLDGTLGTGATVDVTTLHSGTHHISATVTDAGGKKATVERTVVVNARPVLAVTGPASGSSYHPRDTVALSATAVDVEDGNLAAAITWTSSLDGALGTGATRNVTTLTSGTHTITATVADSGGRTASATVTVTIGPLVILHSTYSTTFNQTLGLNTLIDAVGGIFLAGPTNLYPLDYDGAADVVFLGGKVLGQYDRAASWDAMHALNNAAIAFDNTNFIVDGMRIDNVTDAIRPKKGGAFTVRNVWSSYIRDDGVENDHMFDGLVDDSLFDGCYEGFSARPSPAIIASGYSGVGKVWTIQNTLVRLEPQPDPASGSPDGLATNSFFKWHNWDNPANSLSPKLALHNNVFMAERVGQAGGTRMGVPPGQVDSCSNNVIVWLGPGAFPGVLPAGCFTITTDRTVWDNAVADWKTRHPNVGP